MIRMLPLMLLWTTAALAAEPVFEQLDLFEAETGGYAHYRIPGVIVTGNGTLLAYCEARRNAASDWGQIDVLMRRSTDGGRTWDAPCRIVEPPRIERNPVAIRQGLGKPGEVTVNNPVAIAGRGGMVHFLYCVEYGRCYYMRSEDHGLTFGPAVEITPTFEQFRKEYEWKVIATGPGHGIRMSTGRLLVPVWMSTGTGGHAHRPSCVATIYSDDDGRTWRPGSIVVRDPDPKNPSETVAVELSDGRVMLNVRHESRPKGRGVTVSNDGISGWSDIRFDPALPEPVCMGSIVRLNAGGRSRVLFANPHNPDSRERKNLTVKMSEDDGQTWLIAKTIEPGPSGYSDLAAGPDGMIYCFYERGTTAPARGALSPKTLTVARFNLEWLTAPRP